VSVSLPGTSCRSAPYKTRLIYRSVNEVLLIHLGLVRFDVLDLTGVPIEAWLQTKLRAYVLRSLGLSEEAWIAGGQSTLLLFRQQHSGKGVWKLRAGCLAGFHMAKFRYEWFLFDYKKGFPDRISPSAFSLR
jgi:hypothetical protein